MRRSGDYRHSRRVPPKPPNSCPRDPPLPRTPPIGTWSSGRALREKQCLASSVAWKRSCTSRGPSWQIESRRTIRRRISVYTECSSRRTVLRLTANSVQQYLRRGAALSPASRASRAMARDGACREVCGSGRAPRHRHSFASGVVHAGQLKYVSVALFNPCADVLMAPRLGAAPDDVLW